MDKKYAFGTAVRAVGDTGMVEGYLVPFTTAAQKDFYDTYFDRATDYDLSNWPLEGKNVLYHHGHDDTMAVRTIGRVVKGRVDDIGLWVQAQLDLRDEYENAIYALAKRGKIGWSSGAVPASVSVADDGHMERWYVVEASMTPIPATPQDRTQITTIRSAADIRGLPSLKELMAKEGTGEGHEHARRLGTTAQVDAGEPAKEREMSREEIKQVLTELLLEMGITMPEVEVEMAADEYTKATDPEKPMGEEEMRALMTRMASELMSKHQRRQQDIKTAARAAMAKAKQDAALHGQSKTEGLGSGASERAAQDSGLTQRNSAPTISVGSEYDHLDSTELAFAGLITRANLNATGIGLEYAKESDKRLIRALAYRMQEDMSGKGGARMSTDAVRSLRAALPWRANELDATDITGQGLEWVAVAYGSDIWEAARERRIYEALIAKGMQTKEVPLGAKEAVFFTEGADPVPYNSPEANSVDSTGRPEVTVNISPFGTGRVTATLAYTKLASSFTVRLGDSSPADIAGQVAYQMREVALETIENLIMNGDTATAANTNINRIDSTVPTGLQSPYYIGLNGLRKFGLVTNTAQSANAGGTISSDTFKQALGLLPSKLRADKTRLVYILSAGAEQAALGIPEILTRDVSAFATLEGGEIVRMWGIDTLTTGFILPTNTAGKISVTAANNTRGTIILAYPRYWGLGFQRAFNLEVVRDPMSDTNTYIGGFNMSLVSRSNDALSIIYNTASDGV
jgi:HK97 family phage prohead protease